MNLLCGEARYVDELERTLYNAIPAGVSLRGNRYFYENPLEAGKGRVRWSWHACPCCPPMFLKIMGALPGYVYAQDDRGIYVNLFIGSRADVHLPGGKVTLRQTTRYPWQGVVRITVEPEKPTEFDLYVRIPAWCQGQSSPDDLYQVVGRPVRGAARLKLNGQTVEKLDMVRGYARLRRRWQPGDAVELTLDMPVRRVKAHPKVKADAGCVALMRGPILYCLEGVDNGGNVRHLFVPPATELTAEYRAKLLGGITVIRGLAQGVYRTREGRVVQKATAFVAVPYCVNANRGPNPMRVWLPETAAQAQPLPAATLASRARPSASHCWQNDTLSALNDQMGPAASDDTTIPRFTWWDHRGTREWVQYDFEKPQKVAAVEVYWWDERRIHAYCRVPQSWRLLYKDAGQWKAVTHPSEYGTQMDRYNRVTFTPVTTTGLRLEVQLQPHWSGGILEWKVQ